MEMTLEQIVELREKGLSWREIGMFFAQDGEEPYLVGERARSIYRKQGEPVRRSMRSNKDGSATSEVTETHQDPREFDNDALLRYHGYDPSYWLVIESTCTKRGDNWTSRIKEADLATVMQMENAPLWGVSSFRYWFLGHLHQLNIIEKNGVTMIRCRAMALPDEWTSHKGFVGTERGVTCGIIGENTGLEELWLMRP
jgi:DNA repair exonuclease SbcCD nuclease subunit